ncbi:hypothetical protein DPEC_G00247020 [Dallia pectoralis]|uniref:Uncharacterized protein n=1 Tax=Dallia pectoralis TaxID=75939 RepID=A0ACC2FWM8_DALPE|nr:hypothetical protein DPEC_G00247020 [Dallia pectoralis]
MRRYNAVRLTLTPTREAAEDGANQGRGIATTATGPAKRPDSTMTRLEFSRAVLQKGMGFVPAELNCLAKPPGPVETFELKPDPTGVGGVHHLPSTITLGNNRGSVHYYGMPKLCRNCGNLGHLAAACTACKICQGDHLTSDCTTTRPCNLCGVVGHFFRTCPRNGRDPINARTKKRPQSQNLNVKLLGITFQRDGGGSTSWAETICRVQRKICEWSARSLTMTGKTLILKAIVLPILLYLGRVFPPDKATSKKIERLMFTFVRGSQMERLQRSTLYKMVENGGKGVPDILNIIRAQQLSNLVKTFNKPDRKASFFERHYATPILRTLGMGTIDHTVPYSWDPPKVYKAIRDFAFGSGLSTAGLASWKYKDIMGHIRSKDTVAPLRDSSTVAPQQVWLNVNHHCLTNRQKDISWMAVHGCLTTGEFMYRRHIALTVSCPHECNTVESTYHVLAECSVARRVWALFVPSVSHNRLLTLPRLTTENILNGPPGRCTTTELRQQWRIIGVVKQVLWETRNIKVFNKTTVDPTTLRRRIIILLRDHAITDFHKDPVTARAAWGVTRWEDINL